MRRVWLEIEDFGTYEIALVPREFTAEQLVDALHMAADTMALTAWMNKQ